MCVCVCVCVCVAHMQTATKSLILTVRRDCPAGRLVIVKKRKPPSIPSVPSQQSRAPNDTNPTPCQRRAPPLLFLFLPFLPRHLLQRDREWFASSNTERVMCRVRPRHPPVIGLSRNQRPEIEFSPWYPAGRIDVDRKGSVPLVWSNMPV